MATVKKVKKAQRGGCVSNMTNAQRSRYFQGGPSPLQKAGQAIKNVFSGGKTKEERQEAREQRKASRAAKKMEANTPAKYGKGVKKAQLGSLVKKGKAYLKKLEDEGNYQTKSFKTADSLRSANPKSKDLVGKVKERESNRRKADSIENVVEKRFNMPRKYNLYDNKKTGGKVKKAQSGAALTEMGKKTTRAAINKRTNAMAKSLDKASVFGKNYVAPGDSAKKAVKKPVVKKKMGGKCKYGC
jgi:hypothetical protein